MRRASRVIEVAQCRNEPAPAQDAETCSPSPLLRTVPLAEVSSTCEPWGPTRCGTLPARSVGLVRAVSATAENFVGAACPLKLD